VSANVGAGPVLADQWLPAPPEEAAEDERNEYDVVELTSEGMKSGTRSKGERGSP
jgi:hypothetical protein